METKAWNDIPIEILSCLIGILIIGILIIGILITNPLGNWGDFT